MIEWYKDKIRVLKVLKASAVNFGDDEKASKYQECIDDYEQLIKSRTR